MAKQVVTGHRALDRKLAELELKVSKKAVRSSLRKAAKEVILPEAKAMAPHRTGALEGSLVARAIKRSKSRFGYEVLTKDGLYKGDEFYGAFQEFGTKNMEADPYLRPAGYGNEARIRSMVIGDIESTLKSMKVVTR